VATGILPGLLVIALFLVGPRSFLGLGPTAVSLALLAVLFVIALPLHTYRQFQLLVDHDVDLGDCADQDAATAHRGSTESEPGTPTMSGDDVTTARKDPWVTALENALLRRLGIRVRFGGVARATTWPGWGRLSPTERAALEVAYANLDLPPGASMADVGRAYRRLMYLFHPDRHRDDAVTKSMAGELSRRLTISYDRIVSNARR